MSLLAGAFGPGSVQTHERAEDWREATRLAGFGLEASGVSEPAYTAAMIAAIEELGPYMVIAPGLARVHARPSAAVARTGMALALFREPVSFGHAKNDPVHAVFALAALDHDKHIELLADFVRVAGQPTFVNSLLSCVTESDIRAQLG